MSNERVKSGLLGVLPDGWSAERLGNIGLFLRGGGGSKQDEVDDGLPCVRYGDLYTHHDCRITDTRSRISLDRVKSYTPLRYGDVLFASSGETVDDIGRSAVNLIRGRAYCGGDVIILRPAIEINSSFLGHVADCASSRIQKSRLGRGSTVIHIYDEELRDLMIPVPPLEEQRRIAEILDTIDDAIRATERVIAKHKQVRSGLASDLLEVKSAYESRDRVNLSGPPSRCPSSRTLRERVGDVVFLRDCGHLLSGGTPDTGNLNYWDGEIPWITASSLKGRYLSASQRRLTSAGAEAGSRIVPGGTILFVVRGMSLKKEFRVGMAVRPVAFGQDCKALVPADGVDPKYLLFALEAAENRVLRMVDEASHGTGRLQTSLLEGLKLRLPPLEKQRGIIEILDTIDDSIQNNKAQLQKARRLRSGLASELLSGRVRTVAA